MNNKNCIYSYNLLKVKCKNKLDNIKCIKLLKILNEKCKKKLII